MPKCSIDDCIEPSRANSLCKNHYQMLRKYGRTDRLTLKNVGKICSVEDCNEPSDSKGLCSLHYRRKWKNGITEKLRKGDKRSHPNYSLWFERKQSNLLCDEWIDFYKFIEGIGDKPGPDWYLARTKDEKFGPDNFVWLERVRRKPGESARDYNLRQRLMQLDRRPSLDSDRNIKKNFNLSRDDHTKMAEAQGSVCYICKEPEKGVSHFGSIKKLAVDHCHKTGKIRKLLCGRCNTVLGRIEESIELLDAMKAYIVEHSESEGI